MCCTTSDGGAARFRGIASVGKQATSDTGNCGRRKKQGVLKPHAPPCLSLAFDLRRVGSHTAASLPCSAVGAPSSAPKHEARGLSPIRPPMFGRGYLGRPRSAAPSLVPSQRTYQRGSLMHSASVAPKIKPSSSSSSSSSSVLVVGHPP